MRVGDDGDVLPDGATARDPVAADAQRSVDEAVPGCRVAANLVGLERVRRAARRRGRRTATGGERPTRSPRGSRPPGERARVHRTRRVRALRRLGRARVPREVPRGPHRRDRRGHRSDGALVAGIRPGSGLLVQVFCDRPLPLVPGDRFVIRDVGRGTTVAGGCVLDVAPGTIRRGDETRSRACVRAKGSTPLEVARRIVAERGSARLDELVAEAGVVGGRARRRVLGRRRHRSTTSASSARVWTSCARSALELVGAHHRDASAATPACRGTRSCARSASRRGRASSRRGPATARSRRTATASGSRRTAQRSRPDDRARRRPAARTPARRRHVASAARTSSAPASAREGDGARGRARLVIADGIAYPSEVWRGHRRARRRPDRRRRPRHRVRSCGRRSGRHASTPSRCSRSSTRRGSRAGTATSGSSAPVDASSLREPDAGRRTTPRRRPTRTTRGAPSTSTARRPSGVTNEHPDAEVERRAHHVLGDRAVLGDPVEHAADVATSTGRRPRRARRARRARGCRRCRRR